MDTHAADYTAGPMGLRGSHQAVPRQRSPTVETRSRRARSDHPTRRPHDLPARTSREWSFQGRPESVRVTESGRESVRLQAARAVRKELMAVRNFAGLERRLNKVERRMADARAQTAEPGTPRGAS